MKNTIRKFVSAVSSLTVAAGMLAGTAAPLAADAAYGNGGNGNAIMEYLDRGIYAIKSGNGMRGYQLLGRSGQRELKVPR